MRLIAVLAGTCALALTACSSSSPGSSSASSTATSSSSASTAASTASKVMLVVYSAQGYDSAMTKAFTQVTGIPVKLDDNSTGPLLTQIEASKNNPNWGLHWVDGATAFAGLDTQGLLLKGFEPNVQWNTLGPAGCHLFPAEPLLGRTGRWCVRLHNGARCARCGAVRCGARAATRWCCRCCTSVIGGRGCHSRPSSPHRRASHRLTGHATGSMWQRPGYNRVNVAATRFGRAACRAWQ